MLEGIAKELEQQVGKVHSFYLKDCPDLHRVAIKVEKVTDSTVEGFIQRRVILSEGESLEYVVVQGTDSSNLPSKYKVSTRTTANGRKVYLRIQNITAWSPAVPNEASTEQMPRWKHVYNEMNHYHL